MEANGNDFVKLTIKRSHPPKITKRAPTLRVMARPFQGRKKMAKKLAGTKAARKMRLYSSTTLGEQSYTIAMICAMGVNPTMRSWAEAIAREKEI